MNIISLLIFVFLGLMVGSFLNVVIDRLPAGQSLAYPPSHCSACKKRLAVKDLVPVLSFVLLKGRCRYCGEHITLRIPLVESGTAVSFGLIYWFASTHWLLAGAAKIDFGVFSVALTYICLLITLAFVDLEHQLILDVFVYPTAVLALVISLSHTYWGFAQNEAAFVPDVKHAAIGFAIGLVLFVLIYLLSKGGMGLGDVEMAALMGIILGYPSVLVAIFLGIVAGGVVAIALLLTKKKGRKQAIPFGPFLALGTVLALIWGNAIWGWYTRGLS